MHSFGLVAGRTETSISCFDRPNRVRRSQDEVVRSGPFHSPLVYGNPAVDYRLATDLADGRIYRYTVC